MPLVGDGRSPACASCEQVFVDQAESTRCRSCGKDFHLECAGVIEPSVNFGCGLCFEVPGNQARIKFRDNVVVGVGLDSRVGVSTQRQGGTEEVVGDHMSIHSPEPPVHQAPRDDVMMAMMRQQTELLTRQMEMLRAVVPQYSSNPGGVDHVNNNPRCPPRLSTQQGRVLSTPAGEQSTSRQSPQNVTEPTWNSTRHEDLALNVTRISTSREFYDCLEEVKRGLPDSGLTKGPPPNLPRFEGGDLEWLEFIAYYLESTQEWRISDLKNVERLRAALGGEPLRILNNSMIYSSSLPYALDQLRITYGDPTRIVSALEREISKTDCVEENGKNLQNLLVKTKRFVNYVEACGYEEHLYNTTLLSKLTEKLPFFMNLRCHDRLRETKQRLSLKFFSEYLQSEFQAAMDMGCNSARMSHERKGSTKKVFVATAVDVPQHCAPPPSRPEIKQSPIPNPPLVCPCCKGEHRVWVCDKFLQANDDARWKVVEAEKLCWNCLRPHQRRQCRVPDQCLVDGCKHKHHRLLHSVLIRRFENRPQPNMCAVDGQADNVLFKILPIKIHCDERTIATYAFIDEGSSVTLLDAEFAEALGVRGATERLTLSWTNGKTQSDRHSQRVKIFVSGDDGQKYVLDNVRTVRELELPEQSLRREDIEVFCMSGHGPAPYEKAKPGLLIGLRHAHLVSPREVRESPNSSIVALQTKLGWVVYGAGDPSNYSPVCFRVCHMSTKAEPELEQMIKVFYDIDSFGVRAAKHRLGREQEAALEILGETVKDLGGRYEAGLLWRGKTSKLPESKVMCLQRAEGLQRRMLKNPDLAEKLQRLIDDHLAKGYCVDVSHVPPLDPTWYLPVFPVINPKKPEKVRLVFDAAAKNGEGYSLNAFLMTGPDLLTPLPEVLMRFREKAVAVSADIREMFHQVKVRAEDRDAQRFIWWLPGEREPRELRLEVMTFGATCSPTTAQFVMKEHAKRFGVGKEAAVNEILNNYYVDDELSSFDSEDHAISVMKDVVCIQERAGFELQKLRSSHPQVVMSLSRAEDTRKEIVGASGSVLGMHWDCLEDELQFAVKNVIQLKEDKNLTRRKMLSGTMSLFDPLGLAGNVVIKAKLLMKECLPLKWDEKVSDELRGKWQDWCRLLETLEDNPVPRFIGLVNDVDWELHTFVDASEEAYAAVVYVRGHRPDGSIVCSLVMGKTRVAPVRATTMPRMELLAAVLGARLADTVKSALTTQVGRFVYWTDSMDCLCWIRSNHRRYHQFVAARVNEILELTDENDWRWVPTEHNVADDATRFKAPIRNDRWLSGPSFLYMGAEHWPKTVNQLWQPKEEVVPSLTCNQVCLGLVPDPDRFSRWRRLVNTTAYCLRFFSRKSERMSPDTLTPSEIERAEQELWRGAQRTTYSDVITKLRKDRGYNVPKSHPLFKLCVFLDTKEILRVNGRLPSSLYSSDVRQPIVLPNCRITELFVMSVHEKMLHGNHSTVINEIRRNFYIPGLRNLVKKIVRSCLVCRIRSPKISPPREGPLPDARVAIGFRAFSYCGIDYFGPFDVVVGRRHEKRWGVLFTCMTTRAVHIEIAHSLSTESCIMVIRMFCARRDVIPIEMRSDCGTNFVATNKQMNKLINTFPNSKWKFNPPGAPHMGGAWERMIKTVKKCLYNVIGDRPLTDEILRCALIEAEWVVNKHPLTHVPVENEAEPALTPNDFLYGAGQQREEREIIMGLDDGGSLRRTWRLSQQIGEHFWRRFQKEVIPILNLPTKWYRKGETLRVNDAVMLPDDTKRGAWKRGRIVEVISNKIDGQVRQAKVLTSSGVVMRPTVKIAKLDVAC